MKMKKKTAESKTPEGGGISRRELVVVGGFAERAQGQADEPASIESAQVD